MRVDTKGADPRRARGEVLSCARVKRLEALRDIGPKRQRGEAQAGLRIRGVAAEAEGIMRRIRAQEFGVERARREEEIIPDARRAGRDRGDTSSVVVAEVLHGEPVARSLQDLAKQVKNAGLRAS